MQSIQIKFSIINKINTKMKQRFEDEEQCFISSKIEEQTIPTEKKYHHFDLDKIQLPSANQLRSSKKPVTMVPRTIFKEIQFFLLPEILNKPCEQTVEEGSNQKKLRILNPLKNDINEFLNKDRVVLVYQKHKINRNLAIDEQKTGRPKQIASLTDYDNTMFEELKQQKQYRKNEDKIDSNFQSGNLFYAYKALKENEYFLLLEKDVNTHGYSNWFFFRLKNFQTGVRKFHILNIVKKTSLYKQGMKVAIFSLQRYENQKIQWYRGGSNITFNETSFSRLYHQNEKYSSLSFQYNFLFENDEVYFALNQPYTYTRMVQMIKSVQQISQQKSLKCEVKQLGFTISSNIIPSLILSDQSQQKKPIIMVLGRQHPAETVGSFVVEGLIENLLSDNLHSRCLLKKFTFIVVPMVNPDGVIHGNSRCNLAGLDLNRNWDNEAIKDIAPQTLKIRSYITELQKSGFEIRYLIDVHGHGKKLNSFFFVCKNEDRFSYRYFSLAMSKLEKRFDLYSCVYGISKDKEFSIRGQLPILGIKNGFTLENSYFGYGENSKVIPYSEKQLKEIGISLLKSLHVLQGNEESKIEKLYGFNKATLTNELIKKIDDIEREQKKNINTSELLSDSDPDADILEAHEVANIFESKKVKEKKIKQTYKNENKSKKKNSKNKKSVRKNSQKEVRNINSEISSNDQSSSENKIKKIPSWKKKKVLVQEKFRNIPTRKVQERTPSLMVSPEPQKIQINLRKNVKEQISDIDENKKKRVTFSSFHKQPLTNKNIEKKKVFSQIKTQLSHHSPKESEFHQERLRTRTKKITELKEQSLKFILKDTVSILSLGGGLGKRKYKFIEDRKLNKQKTLTSSYFPVKEIQKIKIGNDSEKRFKTEDDELMEKANSIKVALTQKIKKNRAFKRFQNFVSKKEDRKEKTSPKNAVFYYPI